MPGPRAVATLAVACAVALGPLLAGPARAAPGDLDPTFSGDGVTTVRVGTLSWAESATIQGRSVVLGGISTSPAGGDFALTRLRPDGAVDAGFGRDGRVRLDLGRDDVLDQLAARPDGSIVAVGRSGSRLAVVVLTPEGARDRTFDHDGVVTTRLGQPLAAATAVLPASRGRLLVAGRAGESFDDRLVLLRYRRDGSLDTSFSGDGVAHARLGPAPTTHEPVSILRLGDYRRTVVVGRSYVVGSGSGWDVSLVAFRPDGRRDRSFGGGDGIAVESLGPNDQPAGAVVQDSDYLLIGGTADPQGSENDAFFLRVDPFGAPDTAWGFAGWSVQDPSSTEYWWGFAAHRRGAVLAGSVDGVPAVLRLRADGTLDTGFGGDGWVTVPFGVAPEDLHAVVTRPDGRIVAAGDVNTARASHAFGVVRLLPQ